MQDEVFIIEPLDCAFCSEDLEVLSLAQREAHYEHHFLNDSIDSQDRNSGGTVASASSSRATNPNTSSPKGTKQPNRVWDFPKERDVFWYPEQTIAPPSNYTPELIPLIKKGLLKGQSRQLIRRAVLCNRKAVHIHREAWDASWGCGYRNFLMACANLMSQTQQPLYSPLLDSPPPPSVRNLQDWIESAWKEGFDPEGQKELKNLVGTSKWIGTADLWVAFSYRGIPAELVDFDLRNNPQGIQILIDWVVDYFSMETADTSPKNAFEFMKIPQITVTEKMPIILQHNGHSRTIVGYEIDKNGVLHLLAFDPGHRPPAELRTAAVNEFAQHMLSTQDSEGASSSSNLKRKWSDEIVILGVKNLRSPEQGMSESPSKEGSVKLRAKKIVKEPDLFALTRRFSLDTKNMSKKKEYQILYFPMTAPLSDYERRQRKTVRSTRLS